ncbi:hypothetical protein L6452_42100 [Arctium lappa]|uniref:Uncharacterized protein n=1 Tax=Arctium lappa TaxID=4217 RepID=A0ACB8XHB9_ARCLA|nr:hypothetical protein L6452_42100 [Arctium lappa]
MSNQLNMSEGYSHDFNNMPLSEVKEKAKYLARQLSRNRDRADDCEREITKLKSEMLPLEAEIENLNIQNSSLLIQVNALKENSKDSDSIIDLAGIIASKEKEILDLQAKLKRSESSSTWSKKELMQKELDELRRRANFGRETSEELRKSNSRIFAERDSLKDKVISLEIEKERKDFAKKFSDFSRKAFEEKKALELRCVKLSQQVSDFEKVIILEREKAENEKKKVDLKDIKTDFSEEKKIFEIEIAKLTEKLSELSTNIMKEKNAKSELHKKFDLIEKERNKSIAQSPRDDQTDSDYSLKKASSSHVSNVFYNPFCDSDDSLTSKSTNQIRPSNLFYDKNIDDSGNFKKTECQKKSYWRKDYEKGKGNWIWRVKGSSEEKKKAESFVHTSNGKWNYASKGKTFGKPDLVYTINQLIRHPRFKGEEELWLLNKTVQNPDFIVKKRRLLSKSA